MLQYVARHPGVVAQLTLQHIGLTAASLSLALVIAVPLGILAARKARLAPFVLAAGSVIYTIPSLALFALLIPVLGLGFWTAVIGLAAYAQMILVRNVIVALHGVDPAVVEAARGNGMTGGQILWRVERPLAMPVFLAGVRVATVSIIGIATIAAWINAGGLGVLVLDGIEHDYPAKAVAGALAAVALAFAADLVLRTIERRFRVPA
ncbi:MAG TPA: ABC transporter permease [Candidatus Acidoferrales bacterium]|nr:ABC transporter permease [Candidatus Acidoferrales bacterium]